MRALQFVPGLLFATRCPISLAMPDLMVTLVGATSPITRRSSTIPSVEPPWSDTLEVLVAAGWPSVRRLFYRLPERLQ